MASRRLLILCFLLASLLIATLYITRFPTRFRQSENPPRHRPVLARSERREPRPGAYTKDDVAFLILSGSEVLGTRVAGQFTTWISQTNTSTVRAYIDRGGQVANVDPGLWRITAEIDQPAEAFMPKAKSAWDRAQPRVFPSIIHLDRLFPNIPWVFIVDDDTYVFVDNLVDLLNSDARYDHRNYLAAGVVWCRWAHLQPDNDQSCHWFTQGGPGVLLSSQLMTEMRPHWQRCEDEMFAPSDKLWAGDMRIMACMESVRENIPAYIVQWGLYHDIVPAKRVVITMNPPVTVHKLEGHQQAAIHDLFFIKDEEGTLHDLSAEAYKSLRFVRSDLKQTYLLHFGHQLRVTASEEKNYNMRMQEQERIGILKSYQLHSTALRVRDGTTEHAAMSVHRGLAPAPLKAQDGHGFVYTQTLLSENAGCGDGVSEIATVHAVCGVCAVSGSTNELCDVKRDISVCRLDLYVALECARSVIAMEQ
eukprot:TRINITY_DN2136_c0_g1_i1.p1 TRINITY_DN2136_c0_g1~~TRINITY_DN2136_c0_g1_i1.p1  ORF type:complete len:477 (+),score=78.93 TRINITY_DN2136_c0_g1_i1:65-1495(+)